MLGRPPRSPLFPYTTLFRSDGVEDGPVHAVFIRAPWVEEVGEGVVPLARISDGAAADPCKRRSEEHTSELQSLRHLVCRLLLEKKQPETPENLPAHSSSKCA